MAVVTFTKIWINLVATGAAVAYQSAEGRDKKYAAQGSVVSNAGGRKRSITGPGRGIAWGAFTLLAVSVADRTTLESWTGQTVLVRDNRGQYAYGTFFEVDSKEIKSSITGYDVTITLNVVDVTEGV